MTMMIAWPTTVSSPVIMMGRMPCNNISGTGIYDGSRLDNCYDRGNRRTVNNCRCRRCHNNRDADIDRPVSRIGCRRHKKSTGNQCHRT